VSIDVREAVAVERPRADVAAFMLDPANDPRWIGGIREVRWGD
jgi:hypothetical protein